MNVGDSTAAPTGSKQALIKVEYPQQQHGDGAANIQPSAAPAAAAEAALQTAFAQQPAAATAATSALGEPASTRGPSSTAHTPAGAAAGPASAPNAEAGRERKTATRAGGLSLPELRGLLEEVCADRQDAKDHMVPVRYLPRLVHDAATQWTAYTQGPHGYAAALAAALSP